MKVELTEKDELDIVQLYISNHTFKEINNVYHIGNNRIKSILQKNNIEIRNLNQVSKLAQSKREQTCLDRYGVTQPLKFNSFKERAEQTCLEKYGVTNPSQLESVKLKRELTNLDRLGVKNPSQSLIIKQKKIETCLQRFGTENPYQSEEIKEKIRQTNLERYNSERASQNLQIKEKAKQTCLERYGTKYFTTCDKYKNIIQNRTPEQWLKIKQKEYLTKKKNHSFNTSKPEEDYYQYLLSVYKEDDIVRQYRSEFYPFNCDFYIISEDLYIECNYSWTHGGHPYNPDSLEDQQLLEQWKVKSENSDYYKVAIKVWTDLDVRKQRIAKENNLNYRVLYNRL